jgi:hypothetical protein
MTGRWPPDQRRPAGIDALGMAAAPDVGVVTLGIGLFQA